MEACAPAKASGGSSWRSTTSSTVPAPETPPTRRCPWAFKTLTDTSRQALAGSNTQGGGRLEAQAVRHLCQKGALLHPERFRRRA